MEQLTSKLPPLPEDNIEEQYEEESEEEDQSEHVKNSLSQLQILLTVTKKKKVKRRESTSYTPGTSPSEPTLPRHVRPEESPI
ncbi:hypothetical protein O181_117089 [Austropuccinia psidii MF-1]|uniref:Uncharacterized protein n=1 Tax=Austropuccinia psidii MF-1 TaxID=1389203 RepID=A0A9Q3KCM6_9BASI|nr:hypothetical protein [Austropuccinia psidii MF-1]